MSWFPIPADWWMVVLAYIGAALILAIILLCLSPLLPEGHERAHRSSGKLREWWHADRGHEEAS